MARSSHERRPSQEKSILHHICIPNWKARKEKSADELFFASTKVWRVTADPLYSDAVVTEAHARQHNRRGFDNGPPRRPGLRMGATRPWDTIRTQYSATWAKIAFRKYYERGPLQPCPSGFMALRQRFASRRVVTPAPAHSLPAWNPWTVHTPGAALPPRRGGGARRRRHLFTSWGWGCASPLHPPPSRALTPCWHARVRSGV